MLLRSSSTRLSLNLALFLLVLNCLVCIIIITRTSVALSSNKRGEPKSNDKSASTTTTVAPDEEHTSLNDDDDDGDDDEKSATTTTTTTTRRPKAHKKKKKRTKTLKRTTARPESDDDEDDLTKTKLETKKSQTKKGADDDESPSGGSRTGIFEDFDGHHGGQLDEGIADIPGGGHPGCGRAPLNSLTPGGHQQDEYIIGGERQNYGEFPQYIHLETRLPNGMVGLCGGALISDTQILTAAHCVKNHDNLLPASSFTVIFGEDDMRARDAHEVRIPVGHVCVSAKYTHDSLRYDWALLTLAHPVVFTDYIQPACLPRVNQRIHTHGPKSRCFLVGAGAQGMTPNRFNPSKADAIPSSVVNKLHTENVPCMIWGFGAIDHDRVCYTRANNMVGDSCVGDSGGPILCLDQQRRWTVVASVSFGSTFCEHSKVAVYARTRMLLPEIEAQCGIKLV